MTKKYIAQFKAGDLVRAHGGVFKITEDARPSLTHGTREWISGKGFVYYPEAPDCAFALAVCVEGNFPGYFEPGSSWNFQGNFLAGQYTLLN